MMSPSELQESCEDLGFHILGVPKIVAILFLTLVDWEVQLT